MNYGETKYEIFQPDGKTKLASHIWLPEGKPRAILAAVHGGMAFAGDWTNTAQYFKSKGLATYALDLRWHGDFPKNNPGEKNFFHIDSYDTYAKDLDLYLKDIKEKNPGVPVIILSHSNGALISLYYGLTIGKNSDVKGIIASSPWIVNKVKVSPVLLAAAKIISILHPKMAVAPEPLTDLLTHDKEITARHHADEASGVRGTKGSAKLAVVSVKAQKYVAENMSKWSAAPILGIIAGDDHLADPEGSEKALKSVTSKPVEMVKYPQNFHENFNEVNRQEVWDLCMKWIEKLI
jgi:alpha-beta hydrolase superfamily lysophospholipase